MEINVKLFFFTHILWQSIITENKTTYIISAMQKVIYGIGVDIAYIPRFQRTISLFEKRFLQRAFHPAEILQFHLLPKDGNHRCNFVASRWAAKEAAYKAFGTKILFADIQICSGKDGGMT